VQDHGRVLVLGARRAHRGAQLGSKSITQPQDDRVLGVEVVLHRAREDKCLLDHGRRHTRELHQKQPGPRPALRLDVEFSTRGVGESMSTRTREIAALLLVAAI